MCTNFNPIIEVEEDGLIVPDVRIWTEKKYMYFGNYAKLFTQSMRNKWNNLVYIDLFSGCGLSKIKERNSIVLGSPLITMELPIKFDKYILCEDNSEKYEALQYRINRNYSHLNVKTIHGNCNEKIDEIINEIPDYGPNNSMLSFCFIDPYSLNIKFETVKKLSAVFVDILLNLSDISSIRNEHNFIRESSSTISELIDDNNWLEKYNQSNETLRLFIFNSLNRKMKDLRFLEPENFPQIRSNVKNLPLYHLIFYSRHCRGNNFWNGIQQYSDPQLNLGI